MSRLRRLFTAPVGSELFGAGTIRAVFTTIGVGTFLAGALYLPTLQPTRVELVLALLLLLLAVFAVICATFGRLAVLVERLETRAGVAGSATPARGDRLTADPLGRTTKPLVAGLVPVGVTVRAALSPRRPLVPLDRLPQPVLERDLRVVP